MIHRDIVTEGHVGRHRIVLIDRLGSSDRRTAEDPVDWSMVRLALLPKLCYLLIKDEKKGYNSARHAESLVNAAVAKISEARLNHLTHISSLGKPARNGLTSQPYMPSLSFPYQIPSGDFKRENVWQKRE